MRLAYVGNTPSRSPHRQSILTEHDDSAPLFLYYAPHIVHYPLSVPEAWFDKCVKGRCSKGGQSDG